MDMSLSPARSDSLCTPRSEAARFHERLMWETRLRSLRLGRFMMNKAIFPFSKLRIHAVDKGVDCGIHLRSRCLGLYSFATDRTGDFGLMLKLLDSQYYLKRPDLQPISI